MFLSVLGFGFLVGLRHALDSDHVAAVSTLVSRHRSTKKAIAISMLWGVGHTMTLVLVALVLLLTKATLPATLSLYLEAAVGLVLMYLGVRTFYPPLKGYAHMGTKALGVGMLHGIAGSAGLAIVSITALENVAQGVLYTLLFGMGSILGMVIIGALLGRTLVLLKNWQPLMIRLTGVASILIGAFMVAHLLW